MKFKIDLRDAKKSDNGKIIIDSTCVEIIPDGAFEEGWKSILFASLPWPAVAMAAASCGYDPAPVIEILKKKGLFK